MKSRSTDQPRTFTTRRHCDCNQKVSKRRSTPKKLYVFYNSNTNKYICYSCFDARTVPIRISLSPSDAKGSAWVLNPRRSRLPLFCFQSATKVLNPHNPAESLTSSPLPLPFEGPPPVRVSFISLCFRSNSPSAIRVYFPSNKEGHELSLFIFSDFQVDAEEDFHFRRNIGVSRSRLVGPLGQSLSLLASHMAHTVRMCTISRQFTST